MRWESGARKDSRGQGKLEMGREERTCSVEVKTNRASCSGSRRLFSSRGIKEIRCFAALVGP